MIIDADAIGFLARWQNAKTTNETKFLFAALEATFVAILKFRAHRDYGIQTKGFH